MARDELLRKLDRRDAEIRRYLDALTERHVGIPQQLIEAMHAGFARLQEAIETSSAQLQAEIADQRAQIQADTRAPLRVLDRLA